MTKNIISNNYTAGRGKGVVPQLVVIHTYGGPGTNLYNWFNNPSSKVSAHYSVLKSGEVIQYVEESDTAWHAGVWDINIKSIGIEHQDDGDYQNSTRTDALYESSAQLIANIYRRYKWDINDKSRIKPHNEFVTKACPGGLNIDRIRDRVYNILHNNINTDDMYQLTDMTDEQYAYLKKDRPDLASGGKNTKAKVIEWWNNDGQREYFNAAEKLGWFDISEKFIFADTGFNLLYWVVNEPNRGGRIRMKELAGSDLVYQNFGIYRIDKRLNECEAKQPEDCAEKQKALEDIYTISKNAK